MSAGANQFSKTLLLPKTRFPLRNDPAKDESIRHRTSDHLYKWQVGSVFACYEFY